MGWLLSRRSKPAGSTTRASSSAACSKADSASIHASSEGRRCRRARARGTAWAATAGLALAAAGAVAAVVLPALGIVRLGGLTVLLALLVLAQVAWVAWTQLREARRWRRAEGLVLSRLAVPADVLPAHLALADLDAGLSDADIAKVMGGNVARVLMQTLPEG